MESDGPAMRSRYAPQSRPAQLRLPPARAQELVTQLEALAARRPVYAEELRSLLGAWIWAALLRGEVMCIPQCRDQAVGAVPDAARGPLAGSPQGAEGHG